VGVISVLFIPTGNQPSENRTARHEDIKRLLDARRAE